MTSNALPTVRHACAATKFELTAIYSESAQDMFVVVQAREPLNKVGLAHGDHTKTSNSVFRRSTRLHAHS